MTVEQELDRFFASYTEVARQAAESDEVYKLALAQGNVTAAIERACALLEGNRKRQSEDAIRLADYLA